MLRELKYMYIITIFVKRDEDLDFRGILIQIQIRVQNFFKVRNPDFNHISESLCAPRLLLNSLNAVKEVFLGSRDGNI